jgi:hypothetical protein
LRLNPHLHVLFLDGTYQEMGANLKWEEVGHLKTRDVGEVLDAVVRRVVRYLEKHGVFRGADESDGPQPEENLAASAVSGREPPAGPQWKHGLALLEPKALHFDKPLCASLDGFTLHAATRAGGADAEGREALLRYVLRPPVAQERITQKEDGLVRITLKRPFGDGTVAVDMDPLSLLCRLAMSVPPPRFHTVKYAGVLASACPWRARIGRPKPTGETGDEVSTESSKSKRAGYRPWAELLARTFSVDVLACPSAREG